MRFSLQSRYNDYDSKGHVNNAVYLTYFELGRVRAWDGGGGRGGRRLHPGRGEDLVPQPRDDGRAAGARGHDHGGADEGLGVALRVLDARDDRLVAEGETVQVMYDYAARRPCRSPTRCARAWPPRDHGDQAQFEPEEQQAIRARVAAGEPPVCPRDGTPMTSRSIGGGSFGLGYARRREWLICPDLPAQRHLRPQARHAELTAPARRAGDAPAPDALAFPPTRHRRRLQLSRPCSFRTA